MFFIIHLRNISEIEFPPAKAAWRGLLTSVSRVELGGSRGPRRCTPHAQEMGSGGQAHRPGAPSQDTHLRLPENLPACTSVHGARLIPAASPLALCRAPRDHQEGETRNAAPWAWREGSRGSDPPQTHPAAPNTAQPRAAGGRRKVCQGHLPRNSPAAGGLRAGCTEDPGPLSPPPVTHSDH